MFLHLLFSVFFLSLTLNFYVTLSFPYPHFSFPPLVYTRLHMAMLWYSLCLPSPCVSLPFFPSLSHRLLQLCCKKPSSFRSSSPSLLFPTTLLYYTTCGYAPLRPAWRHTRHILAQPVLCVPHRHFAKLKHLRS